MGFSEAIFKDGAAGKSSRKITEGDLLKVTQHLGGWRGGEARGDPQAGSHQKAEVLSAAPRMHLHPAWPTVLGSVPSLLLWPRDFVIYDIADLAMTSTLGCP